MSDTASGMPSTTGTSTTGTSTTGTSTTGTTRTGAVSSTTPAPGRPAPLRAAVALARTELSRIFRDRTGLFFILVLPLLVIIVIGSAIDSATGSSRVGVVDLDASVASSDLVAALERADRIEVVILDDVDRLAVDVRLDRVQAGLVVPAGHGEQLAAGSVSQLEMIVDPSRATSTTARSAVSAVVDRQAAAVAATAFVLDLTDLTDLTDDADAIDAADVAATAASVADGLTPVGVEVEEIGSGGLDAGSPFGYPAAANLVLFTFINTMAVGGVIVESRRLGVTRRLLAGPVTPGTVVAGYAASRFVVALVQGLIVVLAGALLFGVEWGQPIAAFALVVLFSVVAAAAGVLLGAVARTPEQSQSVGVPLGIAMGMLGGALWPLQFVPDWLRQLGHVTPHAWAMDGWVEIIFEGGTIADVAVELAVLAGFGLGLMAIAAVALRRAVTRP